MNNSNRVWICSNCKRVYPQSLIYCPKCNLSKKHATRLVDSFLNKENKIDNIKAKNNTIIENRKRIEERNRK